MIREIRAALKEDKRRQAVTAGEDVERLLSRDPYPARYGRRCGAGIERRCTTPRCPLKSQSRGSWCITWNSTVLYPPPPPGDNIFTSVPPAQIDNYVPTEEEV